MQKLDLPIHFQVEIKIKAVVKAKQLGYVNKCFTSAVIQHLYSLNIPDWSWSFLFILPVKYEFIAVLVEKLSGMDKNDQE